MRRTIASIAAALTIASAAIVAPLPSTDAQAAPSTSRISGSDRWQTSVQLTRERVATGDVVFLASGAGFADALSAAPLVSWVDGQLLLSAPDALPGVVRDRLVELAPSEVVLVGGRAALSDALLAEVQTLLPSAIVDRLAGANRVETSLVVADLLLDLSGSDRAWVASGAQFADALAAAAAAGRDGSPIVLDVHGSDAASTQAWRDAVAPVLAGREVLVAGGTAAVPQSDVDWIRTLSGSTTTRLSGANRYATAIEIADATWPSHAPIDVLVASGAGFADALGASVLSAVSGRPLVLAPPTCDAGVAAALQSRIVQRHGIGNAIGIGGRAALSDASLALTACPVPPPPAPPFTSTHQALLGAFGAFSGYEVSGWGNGSVPLPSGVSGVVVSATFAQTPGVAPSVGGAFGVVRISWNGTGTGFFQPSAGQTSLPIQAAGAWTIRLSDVRSLPELGWDTTGSATAAFVYGGPTRNFDFAAPSGGGMVRQVVQSRFSPGWMMAIAAPSERQTFLGDGPSIVIVESNAAWQLRFR